MIMVYKHMMSKKRRTDVTNLGNLFIVDRIWTTLVALVSGGKLWLVLVKLVVVSVGGVFFSPKMSEQTCTCVTNTNTRRSLHKVNFLSLFVFELLLQGKLFYFHQRYHQTRTSNHGVTSNYSCFTLSSFILVWISFKVSVSTIKAFSQWQSNFRDSDIFLNIWTLLCFANYYSL